MPGKVQAHKRAVVCGSAMAGLGVVVSQHCGNPRRADWSLLFGVVEPMPVRVDPPFSRGALPSPSRFFFYNFGQGRL